MKPVKLILSGFGSYGGREEIDFEKMDKGIFLITGDTGAGKTTIFDAITYALFDETSGGKREGDMMRSQYAKEDVATYVEYTFSYGGQQYCVKRNPNYQRISKRKNKEGAYTYTTQPASVELILPDGKTFLGKSREVNEKIKEILGVDARQFTQISMIAQGEFLKLLHASSKERKEIFSQIFDTGIYHRIQQRLKEQSKELQEKLLENEKLLQYDFSGIWCPNLEFTEKWNLVQGKLETGKEEIFQILQEIQLFLEENEKLLEQQVQKQTQELEQQKIQLAQAEETNRQFLKKKETQEEILDIEKKLAVVGEKALQWNQYQKQIEQEVQNKIPQIDQKLAEANNLLPRYKQYDLRKKELLALEKQVQKAEKKLLVVCKQQQESEEKSNNLQESQKVLFPKIQEIPQIEITLQNFFTQKEALQNVSVSQERLEKQVQIKEKAGFEMMKTLEEFEEASREYERRNRIFIEEQAGILAQTLVAGEPCPVCGAKEHPKKRALSQEAVTQKQVEDAKVFRDKNQKKLEIAQQDFQKIQQECHSLFQVLQHQVKNLEQQELVQSILEAREETIPWERWKEHLQVSLQQCEREFSKVSEKKKLLEQQKQLYQKQEQELEEVERQKKKLEEQKQELQEKSYQIKLAYEKARQGVVELEEVLTFSSALELENHRKDLMENKQQLEEKQKKVLENVQILQQQIARGEGSLEEQKKQMEMWKELLKEKNPVDVQEIRSKIEKLQEEKKLLEEQKITWISGRKRNQECYKNIEMLYGQREALKEAFQVADTLSKTANGNLRQQARVDLETYVQRKYFKHMIHAANGHLVKISGGRFILQCRDMEQLGKQGEAGLDLDVYDLVTDQFRNIKTLSGGESFLAALSMALGMADVIQKNASKVRFDTMFIDEGFGSLDEEARRKSLGILQELAGEKRLIGIISHVTEMKEQLDKKLIISKGNHGSTARWQLES